MPHAHFCHQLHGLIALLMLVFAHTLQTSSVPTPDSHALQTSASPSSSRTPSDQSRKTIAVTPLTQPSNTPPDPGSVITPNPVLTTSERTATDPLNGYMDSPDDGASEDLNEEPPADSYDDLRASPFTSSTEIEDEAEFWQQTAAAYYDYCNMASSLSAGSIAPKDCQSCWYDRACEVYGDCCPAVYARLGHQPPSGWVNGSVRCSRTSFGSPRTADYVMVTQCPADADESLTLKCESSAMSHWNLTQPVTDTESFVTYKNRYCAQCHSAKQCLPWNISVAVINSSTLTAITSQAALYRAAISDADNEVVYTCPETFADHARECSLEPVMSRCNDTGWWANYDANVEKACLLLIAPVEQYFGRFKNPFCYLCNTRKSWTELVMEPGVPGMPPEVNDQELSLLILLDFTDDDKGDYDVERFEFRTLESKYGCLNDQFLDRNTNSCRNIICAPGKQLIGGSNGTCQSSLKFSNVYGFKVCLRHNTTSSELLDVFSELPFDSPEYDLHDTLMTIPHLQEISFAEGQAFSFPRQGASLTDSVDHLYVFWLFSSEPIERDVVDEAMLANLTDLVNVFRNVLNSSGLDASPACTPSAFQQLLGNTEEPILLWEFYSSKRRSVDSVVYLPLTPSLTCPSVELSRDEFRYDPATRELVFGNNSDLGRVSAPLFHVSDSYSALICVSDYRKGTDATKRWLQRSPPKHKLALYWVSLLSTIVSLVFLFISVVIYCLLSSLRNVAGINNLVLSIAMFGAQLFLQVGADVPMADWLCQVTGVMTHFFWLVVMLAQNVCTFHMFYTLSFPLVSHASMANPGSMTKGYVTYVLVTSATFVVATLFWQLLAGGGGGGGGSGYGGPRCYITTALVRVVMFALPLACTVLANLAMFVFTIVRLRGISQHVKSTRSNRISLLLYTKLSVFTGLTWLLGFMASLLESEPLAYLFAVFQGCQGLFVFLAFLANKRVLALLRERVGGKGAGGKGGGAGSKASRQRSKGTDSSGTGTTSENKKQNTSL